MMKSGGRGAKRGLGRWSSVVIAALAGGPAVEGKDVQTRNLVSPAVEQKIDALLEQLTLEEKITLLAGTGMDTQPIPRLGIPSLAMSDGPHGLRWEKATCFPTGVGLAASWDEKLLERVGAAMAREALAKGRNVILGPCVNIHRVPHGGRNFESYSADPYLAARLGVAYIKGVQSEKVVACVKHYACNNQEFERTTINVEVDPRALHEIYLPAFKAAVQEGGVWTVMASYNKINGPYACANTPLLTDILKREWGFAGVVMSDWGAVHDTIPTANAGLDLEMPTGAFFNATLLEAVKKNEVPQRTIDDKIRRILRVMFAAGLFDPPQKFDRDAVDCPAHRALALETARAGIVLLKNEDRLLPLDRTAIHSIAVLGPNAGVARLGGGGSSEVTPTHSISPLDGIRKKVGDAVQVRYLEGCGLPGDYVAIDAPCLRPPTGEQATKGLRGEYFANRDLEGTPVLLRVDEKVDFDWGSSAPAAGLPAINFSVRWTGTLVPQQSGSYVLAAMSDDGSRLFLDDKLLIDHWSDHAISAKTATVTLEAGHAYALRFEYYQAAGAAIVRLGWTPPGHDEIAEAAQLAGTSDVAVVVVGLSNRLESEGLDRTELQLTGRQEALIEAVRAANPRTIVVLNNGGAILMDRWLKQIPALVEAWYPGQEGGQALADVLFGDVNPSGKLPVTFPKSWQNCPAYGNYPGDAGTVRYAEGIFVDYRHFDRNGIAPLFPFGHGLSYTTFEYSALAVRPAHALPEARAEVRLSLKNTGSRAGEEVVQLYVRDVEASLPRPEKELKGYRKVRLDPGQTTEVAFDLDAAAFSFYDPQRKAWVAEPGRFEILIGSSSRDIRARGDLQLE